MQFQYRDQTRDCPYDHINLYESVGPLHTGLVAIGSGAHTAPYPMGTRAKQLEPEADCLLISCVYDKDAWSYTSTPQSVFSAQEQLCKLWGCHSDTGPRTKRGITNVAGQWASCRGRPGSQSGSLLVLILPLELCTVWIWAVLRTFRRYLLPPSLTSTLKMQTQ